MSTPKRNTRITVTGGVYKGRSGLAIRPDGTLHGRKVWLVKLDGNFGGTAIADDEMTPARPGD